MNWAKKFNVAGIMALAKAQVASGVAPVVAAEKAAVVIDKAIQAQPAPPSDPLSFFPRGPVFGFRYYVTWTVGGPTPKGATKVVLGEKSFREEKEAMSFAKTLKRKGYVAVITDTSKKKMPARR